MENAFSAGASALGYLYQVRVALLLFLREGRNNPSISISVEKFDDVAFDLSGTLLEAIQTKHHSKGQSTLSDKSADLWKTIRVWSSIVCNDSFKSIDTRFTLITSGQAPNDSIASLLRFDKDRKVQQALSRLTETAKSITSETNLAAYEAFLNLNEQQKTDLVGCIYIIDNSPDILDTKELIVKELAFMTRPKMVQLLYERLEVGG